MGFVAALTAAAAVGTTVDSSIKQASAAKKAARAQQDALARAQQDAVAQRRQNAADLARANQKAPDASSLLGRAVAKGAAADSQSLLTGASGIEKPKLKLGGSTLLGE